MSYPAKAVANYFIEIANCEGKQLSPMKIQKLAYFAHGGIWRCTINHSWTRR